MLIKMYKCNVFQQQRYMYYSVEEGSAILNLSTAIRVTQKLLNIPSANV